jgi:hypothetical protein
LSTGSGSPAHRFSPEETSQTKPPRANKTINQRNPLAAVAAVKAGHEYLGKVAPRSIIQCQAV